MGCGASTQPKTSDNSTMADTERKVALILVDIQNDFCPGGSLEVPDGDAVVPVANELKEFNFIDVCVLTQDWHPPNHCSFASNNDGAELFSSIELNGKPQTMWPDHCVQGSEGAQFHKDLNVTETDIVVQKGTDVQHDSYSGFADNDATAETELGPKLKELGVTHCVVVGLATEFCVNFTAIDSVARGFDTTVVWSGVRGLDAANCEATRKDWEENRGIKVVETPTDVALIFAGDKLFGCPRPGANDEKKEGEE